MRLCCAAVPQWALHMNPGFTEHTQEDFTCVPRTQRTVWAQAADPQKSRTKVLQLLVILDSLVVQEKIGLHTLWLPFRMCGYWLCLRRLLLHYTALLFQQSTRQSQMQNKIKSKNSPDLGFWPGQNFCMGKGDLIRDPGCTDTLHILKSPKFKKGYTLNSH